MTWPDTYKSRYEVAQRVIRLLHKHSTATPPLAGALAADVEAAVEFAQAIGELDGPSRCGEAALAEGES